MFKRIFASYSVGRGQRAYNLKKYPRAFSILKPVADYDIENPYVGSAQMFIGLMYYYGLGVRQDMQEAEKYIKRAIENDDDYARKFCNGGLTDSKPFN